MAYKDYYFMMDLVEEMISTIARNVNGSARIVYQGVEIDLTPPWPRVKLFDALK